MIDFFKHLTAIELIVALIMAVIAHPVIKILAVFGAWSSDAISRLFRFAIVKQIYNLSSKYEYLSKCIADQKFYYSFTLFTAFRGVAYLLFALAALMIAIGTIIQSEIVFLVRSLNIVPLFYMTDIFGLENIFPFINSFLGPPLNIFNMAVVGFSAGIAKSHFLRVLHMPTYLPVECNKIKTRIDALKQYMSDRNWEQF